MFECKYCNKNFVKHTSLASHTSWCDSNPHVDQKERRRKIGDSHKGKITPIEVKQKISESRRKYLEANPNKVPYLLNHRSKESNPEKTFRLEMESRGLKGWIQRFRHGIYEYDFAFPEIGIDVEIDGQTHELDRVKEIDRKRDEWSLSKGWRIFRIKANQVKFDVKSAVDELEKFIKENSLVYRSHIIVQSKTKKYNEDVLLRKNERKLFREQKRREILESGIDLNKHGSISLLAKKMNVSHTSIIRWLNGRQSKTVRSFNGEAVAS